MFSRIKSFPVEAVIWLMGLCALAFIDPYNSHYTICPLRNLGFDFCPGCGLGRSISFLFRGEMKLSLASHPLGIFAVIILTFRIFQLTFNHFKKYGQSN
ncbi:MAG TPA: DUF2752 domain-containing protein [Ohtaekwangia sp.]